MSIGNTFSGGVFLAIGIVHLLRESAETLEETIGGTWAFIICLSGAMLTFFVEKVMLNREHNIQDDLIRLYEGYLEDMIQTSPPKQLEYDGEVIPDSPRSDASSKEMLAQAQQLKKISGYEVDGDIFIPFMLTLVLSIHGIIAGITMGMHQEADIVTALFIAIITHKWIECLSLGISMKKNHLKWHKASTMILIYSLMVPLGIGIGSFADIWLKGRTLDITSGIFLALSSGTFLYVGFIDILSTEFITADGKYPKFLSLLFGGILATGFILYFDYDE